MSRDPWANIDVICDRFERAWKNREEPKIETFLANTAGEERAKLFEELQAIELAYRQAPTEAPTGAARWAKGMHVRCPHCQEPMEFVLHAPADDLCCTACGSRFSLLGNDGDPQATRVPKHIAHFELLSELGQGGFGTVWKARDTLLDRYVAVKIPRQGQIDPVQAEQFLREARAAAQLRHPHIVAVHEVGRQDNILYIVSDYIAGKSLAESLLERRPTVRQSVIWCEKIARALHFAHQAKIVHRDLKPSNVMLDEQGEPHLMDFGLAKREAGEVTLTLDGQLLGTPAYMAPEQARGEAHQSDRRTDVYSLGAVFFQLLTGEVPFRGTMRAVIEQVLNDEAPSPRKLNRAVPRDLETICQKCLQKDPAGRYASAESLADDLQRFLLGQPIRARRIGPVVRLGRWCLRNPLATITIALTLFVGMASPIVAIREAGLRRAADKALREKDAEIQARAGEIQRADRELQARRFQPEQAESLQQVMVRSARNFFGPIIEETATSPGISVDRAFALLGMAMLAAECDSHDEVLTHFERASDALHAASPPNGSVDDRAMALAYCEYRLARLYRAIDQRAQARQSIESASAILQRISYDDIRHPNLRASVDLERLHLIPGSRTHQMAMIKELSQQQAQLQRSQPGVDPTMRSDTEAVVARLQAVKRQLQQISSGATAATDRNQLRQGYAELAAVCGRIVRPSLALLAAFEREIEWPRDEREIYPIACAIVAENR